ncbi:hypothetical protein [Desulfitobacterium sp. PCE1]|uniref:hypothetical protein n=1 Tax=Desulfitobacterium sp. PCE1 TaxID=146907 RepID=UPI0003636222|nr:hypothetical protein [Desulfitobacterium sp. PCE1]
MKKIIKQYILPVVLSMVFVSIGFFWLYGIPLIGQPEKEDVSYIEIADTNLTDDIRTFTEYEDIEKAVNMLSFLNNQLGILEQEAPFITITYHLKNGEKVDISANKDTVYWEAKPIPLKTITELFL